MRAGSVARNAGRPTMKDFFKRSAAQMAGFGLMRPAGCALRTEAHSVRSLSSPQGAFPASEVGGRALVFQAGSFLERLTPLAGRVVDQTEGSQAVNKAEACDLIDQAGCQ